MALLYGAHFQQDNAGSNKPHILSFTIARTISDDTLLELWNGPTNASIKACVDYDGKYYSADWTAGDIFYAVTGGVANVGRMDSLAVGNPYEVLQISISDIPAWTNVLQTFTIRQLNISPSVVTQDSYLNIQGSASYPLTETLGYIQLTGIVEVQSPGGTSRGFNLQPTLANTDAYANPTVIGGSVVPIIGKVAGQTFHTVYGLQVATWGVTGGYTTTYWRGIYLESPTNQTSTFNAGLYIEDIAGASSQNYSIYTNGGTIYVGADGILCGAATGGDKGTGTINVSVDIYKNNASYNNPDAVLEKVFTGSVVKHKDSPFADYPGLMSLAEVELYAREHFNLPRVSQAKGMFDRSDVVLEKVEELFLYLFDHEKRLHATESVAHP
jgi:hypothetical protein